MKQTSIDNKTNSKPAQKTHKFEKDRLLIRKYLSRPSIRIFTNQHINHAAII